MRSEMTFETAVGMPLAWKVISLENVIKGNSKQLLNLQNNGEKKPKMNNETHFQALIKAAI
jgi:hypothetical protein